MASVEAKGSSLSLRTPAPPCPAGEKPLQSPWSMHWWQQGSWKRDRRERGRGGAPGPLVGTNQQDFLESVKLMGSFSSIEGFWRHFLHVRRPSVLQMGMNIAVFRYGLQPAWESFPNGGCWIIRVPRSTPFLNRMWEELVIAVLGERFLTPEIVGCVLSVRKEYTNITVWNRDNRRAPGAHYRIGERLKTILNLADDSTVDYKEFRAALEDKSTHKNAQTYMFTSEPTDGYA